MVRYMLGSLIALIGAAAVVRSPFRHWYGGTNGRDISWSDLFTGTGTGGGSAALFSGLFLPMLVAAVLVVLGVLLRVRTPVFVAGLLALGFAVLWLVRQALSTSGGLVVGGDGVGIGVAGALAGSVVVLLGGAVMHGRRQLAEKRHRGRLPEHHGGYDAVHEPYDAYEGGYPGEEQTGRPRPPAYPGSAPAQGPQPDPYQEPLPEDRDTQTLPPVTPLRPDQRRPDDERDDGWGNRAA